MLEAFPPPCFGEHGVPVAETRKMTQNLITCLYQTMMAGACRLVTITWCKNLMGQCLSVHVSDQGNCHYTCTVDMKLPWLFWKKRGCKSFDVKGTKVQMFWDLNNAKYVCGPEPQQNFYVGLVCNGEIVLLLGDMQKEAYRKTKSRPPFMEATLLSRREHVFGKRYYSTKAQFGESGRTHEIVIEYHRGEPKEPRLFVRVDRQVVLQVQHLIWKFRGNQTIYVDGLAVEVFWDVHNWLFDPTIGHAVFMFQTPTATAAYLRSNDNKTYDLLHGQWPSSKAPQSRVYFNTAAASSSSSSSSPSSVLQWAASTSSCSSNENELKNPSRFSLLLYAWKTD